jgi:ribosomal subunit interface protein
MQISVSGKGIDVGSALQSHIENQVEEHVRKYIDRITGISVVIAREAHLFRVDITGNLGTHSGLVMRGRAAMEDVYAAFDAALEKVSKQLRRYKRKITNHHKITHEQQAEVVHNVGTKYVVSPDIGEHDEEKQAGLIIAEAPTSIENMTVSQAVMKMDLQDLPAVMFYNSAHGRLNVVYRRVDGNISWVDPSGKAA